MLKQYQKFAVFLLTLLTYFTVWAQDLANIPTLNAPVMDTAQMMSPQARERLNAHLLQYSQQSGSQIVVLTVPKIAPETPFDYSARVMQQWKLGRSQHHDGVLLLLVRDERKSHMAVGRGLEGAIPDVYAKRLLQDVLRPYFKQGQIDEGIFATVAQTEKLIAGERLPENTPAQNHQEGVAWFNVLIVMLTLSGMFGSFLKAILGRRAGAAATSGILTLIAWFMTGSLLLAIVLGIIVFIVSLILGVGSFVSTPHHGGHWRSGGGGFGGGGGFSGGGGGFGGGGASGDW